MKQLNRSTADLVNELEDAAAGENVRHATLVIAYPERIAKVVFDKRRKTLKALNGHIKAGGLPLGIIVLEQEGVMVRVKSHLLAEHVGNEPLEELLLTFVGEIERLLVASEEFRLVK